MIYSEMLRQLFQPIITTTKTDAELGKTRRGGAYLATAERTMPCLGGCGP